MSPEFLTFHFDVEQPIIIFENRRNLKLQHAISCLFCSTIDRVPSETVSARKFFNGFSMLFRNIPWNIDWKPNWCRFTLENVPKILLCFLFMPCLWNLAEEFLVSKQRTKEYYPFYFEFVLSVCLSVWPTMMNNKWINKEWISVREKYELRMSLIVFCFRL